MVPLAIRCPPALPLTAAEARLASDGHPDVESLGWLRALSGTGRERQDAVERLHALLLRTARMRAPEDGELASLLDRAQDELQLRLAELRELARGIHPAVLTERGLEPALQSLVARAPVPVTVEARGDDGRLPGPVESVAYFVVSEALANVAKYAQATQAAVTVERANGHVTIEVSDDGVGGADAGRGSGLRGLEDRLSALDGTLSLDSPAGRGTRLRAQIPCDPR